MVSWLYTCWALHGICAILERLRPRTTLKGHWYHRSYSWVHDERGKTCEQLLHKRGPDLLGSWRWRRERGHRGRKGEEKERKECDFRWRPEDQHLGGQEDESQKAYEMWGQELRWFREKVARSRSSETPNCQRGPATSLADRMLIRYWMKLRQHVTMLLLWSLVGAVLQTLYWLIQRKLQKRNHYI